MDLKEVEHQSADLIQLAIQLIGTVEFVVFLKTVI
jgi:hypothetical protein